MLGPVFLSVHLRVFRIRIAGSRRKTRRCAGPTRARHDRFDTDEQHAKSNVVCNQFVEWGWKSYKEDPLVDVIVFMVYTVLRQGAFTGKSVQSDHIRDFLKRVEAYRFDDIPFPGITTGEPIDPNWHNWRFCGSTHIWPVRWLKEIRKCYKETALRTMKKCEAVPLDLAVWPQVERRQWSSFSLLPSRV